MLVTQTWRQLVTILADMYSMFVTYIVLFKYYY